MIDITYIHHDCFIAESPEVVLIFDYWKYPDGDEESEEPSFLRGIPGHKPLYVFVSHFHKDHFNRSIFSWVEHHSPIHFIISKDTARHVRYLLRPDSHYRGVRPVPEDVTVLSKFDEFDDGIIKVRAFGSTDVGNSYVVELSGGNLKLFHAGDLNCWAWRDESTTEEIKEAETAFHTELSFIANEYPALDIAMFPVDCRIGSDYAQGAREFLNSIRVGHFFPMHFGLGNDTDEQEIYRRGAMDLDQYSGGDGEIILLTRCGDKFRNNSI